MKKIKHLKSIRYIVLLVLALTVLWTGQKEVSADTEQGSITVHLNELGTPKNDVKFSVYRVGSWNGSEGKWTLDESLAGSGVVLDKITNAEELESAAKALIATGSLEAYKTAEGQTDSSGSMLLSGLSWGVYLLEQKSGEDTYGTVAPFLVNIPSFDQDGNRISDLTVTPKAQAPIKEGAGRIEVTKRAGYLDPELLEVVNLIPADAVYYVGIFRDAQGNFPYGTDYIRKIEMKGVSSGTAVFENLPEGTYYIFETDSQGNAYQIDEVQTDNAISWICQLDEGSTQEVKLEGNADTPEGKVGLFNLYYDLPDEYHYQAGVTVKKKVLDEDGDTTDVDDTFYAGIFRDKEGTDLYQVVELVQNGSVSVDVPLGGESGQDPITYYVYETDKDGERIDKDSFDFEVSGEGGAELKEANETVTLTITNKQKPEGSGGSGDSDDSDGSGSSGDSRSSVKTGDNTPIALYIVILAAALAVIIFMIYRKSRKGRK